MSNVIYYGNDSVIELADLRDELTGAAMNSASVEVTLRDSAGQNVSGSSWPVPLIRVVGIDGLYRANLPHDLGIARNARYTATVIVDGGAGLIGRWDIPVLCKDRV